jgi:O-methyltransferase
MMNSLRAFLKPWLLRLAGEDPAELARLHCWGKPSFDGDFLRAYSKNTSWMQEPRFRQAYETGFASGHKFDYDRSLRLEWRVHVALWAAGQALHHEGDFVECGVNTGILSLAICRYYDFASQARSFYLFDTYNGIPESQMSASERGQRIRENTAFYEECYELALKNFSPWPNAKPVRGMVPDTLHTVNIEKVAYLSLDMNIAAPERAALEHFWPKLVRGGVIVLDDYGWAAYAEQKASMDEFAAAHGIQVCCLPTGQGLIVKP